MEQGRRSLLAGWRLGSVSWWSGWAGQLPLVELWEVSWLAAVCCVPVAEEGAVVEAVELLEPGEAPAFGAGFVVGPTRGRVWPLVEPVDAVAP